MTRRSLTTFAFAAALLATAAPARGQAVEATVSLGAGAYSAAASSLQPGRRDVIQVNVTTFFGQRGLLVEYSRWGTPRADYNTSYREADILAGGLRFERPYRRVRAVFDAAVAMGYSRFGSTRTYTTIGAMGGLGLAIPAGPISVRVDSRLYVMTETYVGVNLTAGIGWRF